MKGNTKHHLENVRSILTNIRDYAPITTGSLQELTHYSNSNVALIISKLLASKHIVCSKKVETSVGRKPQKYDINPNDNLIIGTDLYATGLRLVVTDLSGRVKEERHCPLSIGMTKDIVLTKLYSNLDSVMKAFASKSILYIGMSIQGAVDSQHGISKHIAAFSNWDNIPLKSLLEERYKIPTLIAHDTDCLMRTESAFGVLKKKQVSAALLVRIEKYACGMSILANNQLYTGVHGYAGEIGRYPIPYKNEDGFAYLDWLLPESSFTKRYQEFAKRTDINTYEQFMELLASDDVCAKEFFAQVIHALAITLLGLINSFNPEYLILHGDFFKYKSFFEDELLSYVKENAYDPSIRIAFSRQKNHSSAIGAALLASDCVLETFILE